MSNDLVAYSRAGDVFHYRWAARRCLRMIYPNSPIKKIIIEGSDEHLKAGEYVIDMSEYCEVNEETEINYYQLKHTTVKGDTPFILSDFRDTLTGFADRFKQHNPSQANKQTDAKISFTIVTNRKIDSDFKKKINNLADNITVTKKFQKAIEGYTGLSTTGLASFCNLLHFEDGEGNYNVQAEELRGEITQLLAGACETAQAESITAMVQQRVLPDSDGKITREDVLQRFGITSERELYPAPTVWEKLQNPIVRELYSDLNDRILKESGPIIIHAGGGVGKSVFCRQFVNLATENVVAIAYDCFGAGRYRSRSETRHRHKDALIQIINELSSKGYCDPLLPQNNSSDEDITRKFFGRLEAVMQSLWLISEESRLILLIDAADNAEMAALEFNQSSFARELLREEFPAGCIPVFLCRTERIELLDPPSHVQRFEIQPFSESETLLNLSNIYPSATKVEGLEFHRLTNANPRVQANALQISFSSIRDFLDSLSPSGTTVEDQIRDQLDKAVAKIKDLLPKEFRGNIDNLCLGLASLPPHIPIDILAKVSNVPVEAITSFVSDIGRPLWISQTHVQFRDEPTETWFRETFASTTENFESYVSILEPLAKTSTYIAEALPQLYLQAGQYKKLIQIATDESNVPVENPIDARNVRVYQLQFAFKAALRLKEYGDASRVAIRAGEEMAGDERQLELFQKNIDLLVLLQDREKVQSIAFKRLIQGGWDGSENIYAASLLSGIEDFKGEAMSFLRASFNWLRIYFEKPKKENDYDTSDKLSDEDLLEMAYACLNIHGTQKCIDFFLGLRPDKALYPVIRKLAMRLIDVENYKAIEEMLKGFQKKPYFVLVLTDELMEIGRFPDKSTAEKCLNSLCSTKKRIAKFDRMHDTGIANALLSFLESCIHLELDHEKIKKVLGNYFSKRAEQIVSNSHNWQDRAIFLRALAIHQITTDIDEIELNTILPDHLIGKEKDYSVQDDYKRFKEVITGMLPWHLLRLKIIRGDRIELLKQIETTSKKSLAARHSYHVKYDSLPFEITDIIASCLIFHNNGTSEEINSYKDLYLRESKSFWVGRRLAFLRACYRKSHLSDVAQEFEKETYSFIQSLSNDGPETLSEYFIALSRAVLSHSSDDASAYFDDAISIVSKFGEELVCRWEAVASLAEKAAEEKTASQELAYRFIRCAELVGENVYREKYWDRNKAIRLCTKLSQVIGISSLSRWRDRDIGRFENQLEALMIELLSSDNASPSKIWPLNAFLSSYDPNDNLAICLSKETDGAIREKIFNQSVQIIQQEGTTGDYWKTLQEIDALFSINNADLKNIIDHYSAELTEDKTIQDPQKNEIGDTYSTFNWHPIFDGLNLLSVSGLDIAIGRFNNAEGLNSYADRRSFWKQAVERTDSDIWLLIDALLLSDRTEIHDIISLFKTLQPNQINGVGFQRKLPQLSIRIGKRFAGELVGRQMFNYYFGELKLDESLRMQLKEGVFEGLLEGEDFSQSETFFVFVKLATEVLQPQEADELLRYALSRFELHIDEDFGDGPWSDWLDVDENLSRSIAGYIWSALGSPRSVDRWNAAHCIRKVADLNNSDIIDELVYWLKRGKVDAYGNKDFPFYNMHSELYLLIAFARIVIDNPERLRPYSATFLEFATTTQHVLIRRYATDIIQRLESAFPTTYKAEELTEVKALRQIPDEILEVNWGDQITTVFHENNLIDINADFHFGWDFDRYWYEPLGDVFSVPGEQIQDLAADVIRNEWHITGQNGYSDDPRVILWNRSSSERETWHDHGNYPETDNLRFYLSYHAMFVVAGKLLDTMPITSKRDWGDNPWVDWMESHIITRVDGRWLADARDAAPLDRPQWINKADTDIKAEISEKEYFDSIVDTKNGETYLTVKGGWSERDYSRTENIQVTTALVSPETSDALLNALSTYKDHHDYLLPQYESKNEIDTNIFQLKGWLIDDTVTRGLDDLDPRAENVDYPPYKIGQEICDALDLSTDWEQKEWYSPLFSDPSLQCTIWCTLKNDRDRGPGQSGKKLSAKLDFLKELCKRLSCNIIFETVIRKDTSYRSRRTSDDDGDDDNSPIHKIYILSEDGKFKTTGTSHQLG